jgi:hypothetical protein
VPHLFVETPVSLRKIIRRLLTPLGEGTADIDVDKYAATV